MRFKLQASLLNRPPFLPQANPPPLCQYLPSPLSRVGRCWVKHRVTSGRRWPHELYLSVAFWSAIGKYYGLRKACFSSQELNSFLLWNLCVSWLLNKKGKKIKWNFSSPILYESSTCNSNIFFHFYLLLTYYCFAVIFSSLIDYVYTTRFKSKL